MDRFTHGGNAPRPRPRTPLWRRYAASAPLRLTSTISRVRVVAVSPPKGERANARPNTELR